MRGDFQDLNRSVPENPPVVVPAPHEAVNRTDVATAKIKDGAILWSGEPTDLQRKKVQDAVQQRGATTADMEKVQELRGRHRAAEAAKAFIGRDIHKANAVSADSRIVSVSPFGGDELRIRGMMRGTSKTGDHKFGTAQGQNQSAYHWSLESSYAARQYIDHSTELDVNVGTAENAWIKVDGDVITWKPGISGTYRVYARCTMHFSNTPGVSEYAFANISLSTDGAGVPSPFYVPVWYCSGSPAGGALPASVAVEHLMTNSTSAAVNSTAIDGNVMKVNFYHAFTGQSLYLTDVHLIIQRLHDPLPALTF
jgi:hypothetical protein